MHRRTFAPWVLTAIALWLPSADAFSACDDLDVVFMIDTEAFEHPFESMDWMDVIMHVVEDGSSEDDGFSVVFYGENIPNGQNAVVISYNETQPVHSRAQEVELIKAEVTAAYEAVQACRLSGTSDDCASVSLMDAFELATSQSKPVREHVKAEVLSGEGYVVDQDDDATRFIFVDYTNEVIPESGVASDGSVLCELLEYESSHEAEKMHFLFGQTFDADTLEIDCTDIDVPDDLLTQRMFEISAVLEASGEDYLLEMVYQWTCPSWVVTETEGSINLGNHNQWMDIDTIIECSLVNVYEDDVTQAIELTDDSYVKVKDIEDSLNTFKVNDFLLEYPAIRDELEERGCWLPVLKILAKVELTDEACDEADCTILQLTVQVPESPNDYINEANVTTNSSAHTDSTNTRRRAQDVHLYDDALEEAMRRQLISGSQHWEFLDFQQNYTYSASYNKSFERVYEPKSLSKYSEPVFTFTGDGSLTIDMGVEVSVKVGAYIHYELRFWGWKLTKLYAALTAEWEVKAYFGVELAGNMRLDVEDILKYEYGALYWIGIVPIWVNYYITLDAALVMVPIRLYAGVECSFGETRTFGINYDSKSDSSDSNFFATREPKDNGCTPKLEIGSEDENAEDCPVAELGFDVEVIPEIGASIYWSLAKAYVKPKVVVPFRITMPEMRESVCAGAEASCDDVLMASFNVAMYLQIYLGGKLAGWEGETQVGGDITIIEPTALGCTTLDGGLSFLNDFYRWSGCCADDAESPLLLPSPPSEIVFDLSYASSHWVGGLVVLLAALLLLILCRFVAWPRRRIKYVHVAADCDSEDFTDNEAKPINVDLRA